MDCDIIIPVYNHLNYTRACFESITKYTHYPYSTIVVDDSSDKATAEYLDQLNRINKIILLRNEKNQGWLKSVNRAIRYSKAKYVCVMNNDTLVYPGWLEEMINIAQKEEYIGFVNPSSNTLGQNVPKNETVESYSKKLNSFKGKYKELDNCMGFCMLIKRRVVEKIGCFDEIFSPGYWEESDYCRRAYKIGYISVCAKGAYVYHYEKVSFGKKNKVVDELKKRNREIYCQRYNPLRIAVIVNITPDIINLSKNLLSLARQGNIVYVFMKHKIILDVKEHSNIRIFYYPIFFYLLLVFKSINRNKKKDYNLVITPSNNLKKVLLKFSFLRKYKIISYDEEQCVNFITGRLKDKTSIILGIGPSMFHDPAAVLLIDGKVVAAAEEERFIRKKHASSQLCLESTAYCLKQAGIKTSDIDKIVFAWDPAAYKSGKFAYFGRKFIYSPDRAVKTMFNAGRICRDKIDIVKRTCLALGIDFAKAVFIEHHLAHAASAYYFSGFRESAILSIDGSGEFTATWIGKAKNNDITRIKEFSVPESLGLFYSTLTEYLGFESNDGEYKLMGMAPYGDASRFNFDDILAWDKTKKSYHCNEDYIWVKRSRRFNLEKMYSKLMVKRFGLPRKSDGLDDHFVHIAASTQKKFEDIVLRLVDGYLSDELMRHGNLCFAGGCALNVSLNLRLLEHPLIKNLWVQPASNDSGTSLGSAAYVAAKLGNNIEPMKHVYYGPQYLDQDIESALHGSGYKVFIEKDICLKAAQLLHEGKIFGWFQGRMEWGPRALGNRSIIGNPTIKGTADKINAIIKFREAWRPFCPSILKEYAAEILDSIHPAPFMTIAFKVNKQWAKRIPEVVHVDGTCRPQVVDNDTNPRFHSLIENYHRLSGVPVVINTSLNRRGEPMVCSPADALMMFKESGLEYLIMGDYLVMK